MRALIVALQNYRGVSRLPGALRKNGIEVGVLSPRGSFLTKTRHVARHYRWPRLLRREGQVLAALASAIRDFDPRLIIPADQRAAFLLSDIASGRYGDAGLSAAQKKMLLESIGDPALVSERLLKSQTVDAAAELGAPVPTMRKVATIDEVLAFAQSSGYPVVLKDDLGQSGSGVRICPDERSLRAQFATLRSPRSVRDRDSLIARIVWSLFGRFFHEPDLHHPNGLSAEQFISGTVAMRAIFAWRGEVLAGVSTLREIVHPAPLGPASLIKFVDHPDMEATVRALVNRWGASGFLSFDFVVSDKDGKAYLLECNPRPVPVSHLGGFDGNDLCAALAGALSGNPPRQKPGTTGKRITLFPQEWGRDPQSHWLHDEHHDVPWDDPDLLVALLAGWPATPINRLVHWLRHSARSGQ